MSSGWLRFVLAGSLWLTSTLAAADQLKLAPGTHLLLVCETQAVVMLPTAATTAGKLHLKLEVMPADPAAAAATEAPTRNIWSVADVAIAHTASFAARDRERCAKGCELTTGDAKRIELWSPKRVAATALSAGEPLTVLAIDRTTLKLTATTVIGSDITALEQGECKGE